jgi:hypothetical protein
MKKKPITRELLANFPLEKMVYAEYGELGAMGAEGQVYCYIIENNELVQYYTNIREHEDFLFYTFLDLIEKHTDTTYYYYLASKRRVPEMDESIHFFGIYGSLGNHALFNRYKPVSFNDLNYFIEIDNKRFEFDSCIDYIYDTAKPQIITVYDYLKKNGLDKPKVGK